MCPRGGADQLILATDLAHKRSTRVTRADSRTILNLVQLTPALSGFVMVVSDQKTVSYLISALNRVINSLSGPGKSAPCDRNIVDVSKFEISRSSSVGAISGSVVFIITKTRRHQRCSISWARTSADELEYF